MSKKYKKSKKSHLSPLKWYGGKARLVKHLLPLLPQHSRYVEVCGGGGQVLFAKSPAIEEVFNDLDSDLLHFWRVVKDPILAPHLIEALRKTPVSRKEYDLCNALYDKCNDPIERARQFFVLVRQSFNAVFRKGWSDTTGPKYRTSFPNAVERLAFAHERLQTVTLENLDFRELIPKYDSPDTLFYIDPPYLASTRAVKTRYQHEMTDFDHAELLKLIMEARGKIILSGYASPLYDLALPDWQRIEIILPRHAAQVGNHEKPHATEVIWINPAGSVALSTALLAA